MDPVWFRRFADIPGVRYQTPPVLDLSRLKRRNAVPTVHRFEGLEPSLFWETSNGGTSQAPAGEHALGDFRGVSLTGVRENIAEVLELPGQPSDYHFALQSTTGELYGRRRDDPTVLDDVERLCLLDLQLIESCPFAVMWEREGQMTYFQVSAFSRLLRMYLTEGRVAEAVAVADIAERFDAGGLLLDVAAARQRAAVLAAEDMP
jgi:hypothetical protein